MSAPIIVTNDPVHERKFGEIIDHILYRKDLKAGTARWRHYQSGGTVLEYVCPCGCGFVNFIAVYRVGERAHGWRWNGDEQKPTLSPSIQQTNRCAWHGHLIDGVFK